MSMRFKFEKQEFTGKVLLKKQKSLEGEIT